VNPEMQMKAWLVFIVAGGFFVLALGTTNPCPPVDARLLEVLAAEEGSDWSKGWKAALVRWNAGPEATNPEQGLQRLERASIMSAALPLVRDSVVFLFIGIVAAVVAFSCKKAARAAPWAALALLLCWLTFASWHRTSWSIPGFSTKGILDLPEQFIGAHKLAHESAGEATVWMSPAAIRWLPQVGIPIPPEAMKDVVAEAGNAPLWRARAAERNTGAVLLIGNVAEYRPVLDFLQVAPGWGLSQVEPLSLVFTRRISTPGSGVPGLVDAVLLEQRYPDSSRRAAYLAQLATMLTDLGAHGDARRMFRQAVELDGQRPDVRSLHASFLARRGQWQEAIFEAREVLETTPRYIPALQVLVQAELAADRPENAWHAAKSLLRLQPHDPYVLFLHARAANAAGASFAETASLRHLIRLTSQMGLSTSGYRVFLGKSLAKQGLVDQSRREFEAALAAGDLIPEEEEQVNEFLTRLDEASGS